MEDKNNNTTNKKVVKIIPSKMPAKTSYNLEMLSMIPNIEKLIDSLKASSIVMKNFAKTDKDGNSIVDPADVMSCILLGNEMGLPPAVSINFGKQLNVNKYFSVLRGRELNLDPITSMDKIYRIPTQNGDITYIAVDIISKAIIDSDTEIHKLHDNIPTITYKDLKSGKYIGHYYNLCDDNEILKDNMFIYVEGVTDITLMKEANNNNKLIAAPIGVTNVTSIRFVRKSNNINMIFHYSLQDATDAGLYNGYHSSLINPKGKPLYIKGKSNWNNHPTTHLRNRVLSIGGRVVVADKLQGSYSKEEASEIANIEYIDMQGEE